ncbi:nucleotidyltransferase family protein [Brevundimonas sp.]|uniref:nucleotidyltransferase family protein n=1 Tax=Brevundimonas sp. TaxID=1871086 RepID=UPI003D0BCDA7
METLRGLGPSLRGQGIAHLYLFGSVARGDATGDSDVDIAFDVQPQVELKFSLIDQSRIHRQITAALNTRVDFVERAQLRDRIARSAAEDMIQVF